MPLCLIVYTRLTDSVHCVWRYDIMRHRKSPVTRLSNSAVQCRVDSGPRGERGVGEILGTLLCRHSSLEQAQRNKRQRKKGKGRVGWGGGGEWGVGERGKENKIAQQQNGRSGICWSQSPMTNQTEKRSLFLISAQCNSPLTSSLPPPTNTPFPCPPQT